MQVFLSTTSSPLLQTRQPIIVSKQRQWSHSIRLTNIGEIPLQDFIFTKEQANLKSSSTLKPAFFIDFLL